MTDTQKTITVYGKLFGVPGKTTGFLRIPDLCTEHKFNQTAMAISTLHKHVQDDFRKYIKDRNYVCPPEFCSADEILRTKPFKSLPDGKEFTDLGLLSFTFPKPELVWDDTILMPGVVMKDLSSLNDLLETSATPTEELTYLTATEGVYFPTVGLRYPYIANPLTTIYSTLKEMIEERLRTLVDNGHTKWLLDQPAQNLFLGKRSIRLNISPYDYVGVMHIPVSWPRIDWGDAIPSNPDDDDDDEEDYNDYPKAKKKPG